MRMTKVKELSLHDLAENVYRLTSTTLAAADASGNEEHLERETELSLRSEYHIIGFLHLPYQFEYARRDDNKRMAVADGVHGEVVEEYEPPKSFSAGNAQSNVEYAKGQSANYTKLMARDEGRPIDEYVVIVWDGTQIAFGTTASHAAQWERLVPFGARQAARLLTLLSTQGSPLVQEVRLLRTMIGPKSEIGAQLIPALFEAVNAADIDGAVGQTKLISCLKSGADCLCESWVFLPVDFMLAGLMEWNLGC